MNSRPPPTQGPSMALRRAYAYNLRPIIVFVALISGIWALLSCISSFSSIKTDQDYGTNKLATFAIVLGIIYAAVCGIEAFGVATGVMQRLFVARIYSLLSVVSALAVVAAGFVRVIAHFSLKNDLMNECEKIVVGDVVVYEYGFWGPTFETQVSSQDAASYCKNLWHHDSAVEIISLLIEIFLAAFFTAVSFAYYHQLLDPTSAANRTRRPVAAQQDSGEGDGAYPSHYNLPYLGYNAPAAGAQPIPPYDSTKDLPYGGAKPPMYSEEDVGLYGASKADPFTDFDAGAGVAKNDSRSERGEASEFV